LNSRHFLSYARAEHTRLGVAEAFAGCLVRGATTTGCWVGCRGLLVQSVSQSSSEGMITSAFGAGVVDGFALELWTRALWEKGFRVAGFERRLRRRLLFFAVHACQPSPPEANVAQNSEYVRPFDFELIGLYRRQVSR